MHTNMQRTQQPIYLFLYCLLSDLSMNDQWSLIEAGHLLHILDRMPPNVGLWLQNRIRLLQSVYVEHFTASRKQTLNDYEHWLDLIWATASSASQQLLPRGRWDFARQHIRLRKGVSLSPTGPGPAAFLNFRITVDVIWTVASNRSESQVTYRPKLQELYISFFYSLNYSPLLRVFCYFLTFWNGDKNCCHSCFEIIVGHKMTVKPL